LTDFLVSKLPRNAVQKNLVKAWKEQGTLAAWEKSAWAKKLDAKKRRKSLSDFDRYKVMIAKRTKSKEVSKKM